jgi:hypothetical protein
MNALKYLLLTIVILFISYTLWMITLPGGYNVSRSITIDREVDEVFAYAGDLSHFESWTTWFQGDTLELTVSNPSSGTGASVVFDDKKGASGKFLFTKVMQPSAIDYEVHYNNRLGSVGTLSFAPENRGTKVTWTFEGEMPFYFRWVILSMDRKVGKDFEESLSLLKKNIESIAIEEENS